MSPKERVLKALRKSLKKAKKELNRLKAKDKILRAKQREIARKRLAAASEAVRIDNEITVINTPYRRWGDRVLILSPQAREIIDREMRKGK